jgi:hypothetical protein
MYFSGHMAPPRKGAHSRVWALANNVRLQRNESTPRIHGHLIAGLIAQQWVEARARDHGGHGRDSMPLVAGVEAKEKGGEHGQYDAAAAVVWERRHDRGVGGAAGSLLVHGRSELGQVLVRSKRIPALQWLFVYRLVVRAERGC